MKISSLTDAQRNIVQNNNGLKVYLENLSRGREATPRSWLYENKQPTEVLRTWINDYLRPMSKQGENEKLVYRFDISKLKKCAPQGQIAPIEELMEIVEAGFGQEKSSQPALYRTKLWQQAKDMAVKRMIKDLGFYHTLRPRAVNHVIDDMAARDTLESNSGWPDFTRRNLPEVQKSAVDAIKSGAYLDYPAIVLFRNYKAKTRMVWMYPLAVNIREAQFTQPLKEVLVNKGFHFVDPWRGYDHVLASLTKVFEKGHCIAASDFSHTDEHFTKYDTLEVFDVIKHAFQPQYWAELKQSMLHVNEIPVVVGVDKILSGDHGVSSGSDWTNDLETYYDCIFECYFILLKLVIDLLNAIGDDVSHEREDYLKDLASKLAEEYKKANKDVNSAKVTNERDWVVYLQRFVKAGYYSGRKFKTPSGEVIELLRGVYSTVWALWSSLMPEKFHSPKMVKRFGLKFKDLNASRLIMIAENCIDHPLYVAYVKYIVAGQRYLIEFCHKSVPELREITEKSRSLPGFNPTFNQEKRDKGLQDFETVKLIRKLYPREDRA